MPRGKPRFDLNDYTDTGCAVYSACLSCPLPAEMCDGAGPDGRLARSYVTLRRVDALIADEDLTEREIASRLNISLRHVYRAMDTPRPAWLSLVELEKGVRV
jgi:hypothetical protein